MRATTPRSPSPCYAAKPALNTATWSSSTPAFASSCASAHPTWRRAYRWRGRRWSRGRPIESWRRGGRRGSAALPLGGCIYNALQYMWFTDFEWPDGIAEKVASKHGLDPDEVERSFVE